MAYTLLLVFCGLFGVEQGLRLMMTEYTAVPAGFILAFVWTVIRTQSERLSTPPTGIERRMDQVSRKLDGGNSLDKDSVQFLINQLTNPNPVIVEKAAKTLVTVAARQPEQVAPYADELLTHTETAAIPVVQQTLLTILSNACYEVEDNQRLATVGGTALQAESSKVRDTAPLLLMRLAADDPTVLADSVAAMQTALPRISPAERGCLVLALTFIETAGVSPPTDFDASQIVKVDTDTPTIAVKEQLLRSLPADARETASILAESLEDLSEARPRIVSSFRKLGEAYPASQPAVATLLIAHLEDTDPETRANIGMALRSFAEDVPAAVGPHRAALRTALSDSDPRVRRDITGTIGLLAEQYPDAIETYSKECCSLLDGDEGEIRKNAAWALATFAETSPKALELQTDRLVTQLNDPHEEVREFTVQALTAIAEVAPESVAPHADILRHHLTDPAPDVPMWVSVIFARLVDSHPAAVAPASDTLVELLGTEDGVFRHNALVVLGGISQADSSSVEAGIEFLIDRLEAGDEEQRTAAWALATLVPYAPILIESRHPRLVAALSDGLPDAQPAVLELIGASVREGNC